MNCMAGRLVCQLQQSRVLGSRCFIPTSRRRMFSSPSLPSNIILPRKLPFGLARSTQVRLLFDNRKKKKRRKSKDPFKILGVPEGILFKDVKKEFLKIAMKNHPDTVSGDLSDDDKDKMRDDFIRARVAFETLMEDTDGTAVIIEEAEENAMDNFDSWFKDETGFESPFAFDIDPETMKEVASMTDKIGGGLDRDGGMWALARMVTSAVKTGGDAGSLLRLEAGDPSKQNKNANGALRRRRKR